MAEADAQAQRNCPESQDATGAPRSTAHPAARSSVAAALRTLYGSEDTPLRPGRCSLERLDGLRPSLIPSMLMLLRALALLQRRNRRPSRGTRDFLWRLG